MPLSSLRKVLCYYQMQNVKLLTSACIGLKGTYFMENAVININDFRRSNFDFREYVILQILLEYVILQIILASFSSLIYVVILI